MRKIAAQQTSPRPYLQQETKVAIVPPATGGWNNILPLWQMEPQYAPVMQNWVPRTGFVELRAGYSAWNQSLSTSAVESVMTYRPAGSSERMFAATNGSIYDVTNIGSATQVQTGLGNNRWQYINFTPALGANYIYLVNGTDNPRYFDGTSWTQPSITGGPAPSTFINIASTKRRIWFVQENSTVAWYLGTDAVQGALAGNLDLGSLWDKGGRLLAINYLTLDGGMGPDDYTVFMSSRGQFSVYKGTDPTNANLWSLQGTFNAAPPLGNRCLTKYGADLVLISLEGVLPLSQEMPIDSAAIRGIAITNKIQNVMLQQAAMSQNNFGWEMISYPAQGLFILNVPVSQFSGQQQFVMNGQTGAWCQFTGWSANCFTLFNDQLFFGDNKGNVNLAWSGAADLVTPIVADMQCAFNYFGDPGRVKQVTMIQPILKTSGALTPTLGIDVDFGSVSPTAPVTITVPTGSQYNTAIYNTSTYAAGVSTQSFWQGAQAEGKALAVRMKVQLLPQGPGGTSVFDTGVFDTAVFDGFGTATTTLQSNLFNVMIRYGGAI